jgi:plasmid stabilization system protein ParE
VTPHIRLDVLEIVRSMIDDNPQAAERFVDQLPIVLREIAMMPGMGSPKHFRGRHLANVRSWRIKGFPRQLIL